MRTLRLARCRASRRNGRIHNFCVPLCRDGFRLGLAAVRTGIRHDARFGASGLLRDLSLAPIVLQHRNDFLFHQYRIADRAMLALGEAGRRASRRDGRIHNFGVPLCRDGFRLGCAAARAGDKL